MADRLYPKQVAFFPQMATSSNLTCGEVQTDPSEKGKRPSLLAFLRSDGFFNATGGFQPILPRLKKRRKKSTCCILACTFYFRDDVPSDEMIDIINLLTTLSVDSSLKEFNDILAPIIRDTVLENRELWQRLEQEFPEASKMIEADVNPGPEGDRTREELRQVYGIHM